MATKKDFYESLKATLTKGDQKAYFHTFRDEVGRLDHEIEGELFSHEFRDLQSGRAMYQRLLDQGFKPEAARSQGRAVSAIDAQIRSASQGQAIAQGLKETMAVRQEAQEIESTNIDMYKIMFGKMGKGGQTLMRSALLSDNPSKEQQAVLQNLHDKKIDLDELGIAIGIQTSTRRDQDIKEAMGAHFVDDTYQAQNIMKTGNSYEGEDPHVTLASKLESSGVAYKYKKWFAKAQADNGNLMYQKLSSPLDINGVRAEGIDPAKVAQIIESRGVDNREDTGSWDTLKATLTGAASGRSSDVVPVIGRNQYGAYSIPKTVASKWYKGIQDASDTSAQLKVTRHGDKSLTPDMWDRAGKWSRRHARNKAAEKTAEVDLYQSTRTTSLDMVGLMHESRPSFDETGMVTSTMDLWTGVEQTMSDTTNYGGAQVRAKTLVANAAAQVADPNPASYAPMYGSSNVPAGSNTSFSPSFSGGGSGSVPPSSGGSGGGFMGPTQKGRYAFWDTKAQGKYSLGFTGSRVGALLGNNPYQSASQAKAAMVFGSALSGGGQSSDTMRGNIREEEVAKYFGGAFPEWKQAEVKGNLRYDTSNPLVAAEPDRYLKNQNTGERAVLEIKSVQKFKELHHYQDQLQAEMHATGYRKAFLTQERWDEFRGEYKYLTNEVAHDPEWYANNKDKFEEIMSQVKVSTPKKEVERLLGRSISDSEYERRMAAMSKGKFEESSLKEAEGLFGKKGGKELLSDKHDDPVDSFNDKLKKASVALSAFTSVAKGAARWAGELNRESETAMSAGMEHGDYFGTSVALQRAGMSEEAANRAVMNASSSVHAVQRNPNQLGGMLSQMVTANALSGGKGFDVRGTAMSLLTGDRKALMQGAKKYAAANSADQASSVYGVLGLEQMGSATGDISQLNASSVTFAKGAEEFTKTVSNFTTSIQAIMRGDFALAGEGLSQNVSAAASVVAGDALRNTDKARDARAFLGTDKLPEMNSSWENLTNVIKSIMGDKEPAKVEVNIKNEGSPVEVERVSVYKPWGVGN